MEFNPPLPTQALYRGRNNYDTASETSIEKNLIVSGSTGSDKCEVDRNTDHQMDRDGELPLVLQWENLF